MGYISDSLKSMLGGKDLEKQSNKVLRDWTPNNVKVLILGFDYILIINHLGGGGYGFKYQHLNSEEVLKDIENTIVKGSTSIIKALDRRSLSCLEEIYFDHMYRNERLMQFVDILKYAKGLGNSRLRQYGYGFFRDGVDESQSKAIRYYYSRGRDVLNGTMSDYASVTSCGVGGLEKEISDSLSLLISKKPDNDDWYKKYYLRPQFYALDSEKGNLMLHFRKFEREYLRFLEISKKEESDNAFKIAFNTLVSSVDSELITKIAILKSLLKPRYTLKDELAILAVDSLKTAYVKYASEVGKVAGLTSTYFNDVVTKTSCLSANVQKEINNYGVFDSTLNQESLKAYVKNGGKLVNVDKYLDIFFMDLATNMVKVGYEGLVGVEVSLHKRELPNCMVTAKYGLSCSGTSEAILITVCDLVGVDHRKLNAPIRGKEISYGK